MTLDRNLYVHAAPEETRPLVPSTSPLDPNQLDIPLYEETDFLQFQGLPANYRPSCWSRCRSQLSEFMKIAGPGFVVAIGYMDPGNWATDLVCFILFDVKVGQRMPSNRPAEPNTGTPSSR